MNLVQFVLPYWFAAQSKCAVAIKRRDSFPYLDLINFLFLFSASSVPGDLDIVNKCLSSTLQLTNQLFFSFFKAASEPPSPFFILQRYICLKLLKNIYTFTFEYYYKIANVENIDYGMACHMTWELSKNML